MRPINQACKMHVQILESKLGLHRLCSFCINTYTHTIILNVSVTTTHTHFISLRSRLFLLPISFTLKWVCVVVTGGRGRRNNLDGETDANILDMDM